MPFQVLIEHKPNTLGLDDRIWALEDGHGGRVEIWPAQGFNAYRWRTATGHELLYADPKFAAMAEGMVTRATRAVQLWFDTDLAGLGWPVSTASAALGPVVGSYAPAYKHNSWADMSQVVPRETWGANGPSHTK